MRGTFAALGDPVFIAHLRRLGVTTLELLPIHAFVQDRSAAAEGTAQLVRATTAIGFFAPEPQAICPMAPSTSCASPSVACTRPASKLILDVVYNHTAEGSELGPTLSFRGLDNASYYRLVADNPRHCVNDTGTGNTLNLSTPRVLQMVMDSLRCRVTAFHVDGFRFDLGVDAGAAKQASIPARASSMRSGRTAVLQQGEADLGAMGHPGRGAIKLGNHPPGFAEWNDRFRDGVRRYWRGDPGQRADFAARLAGSVTCSTAVTGAPGPRSITWPRMTGSRCSIR